MRLAFIHPSFTEQGGAENYLITLMQALAARGHDIHLFTPDYDDSLYPSSETAAYHIHRIGGRGYMEGLAGTLRLARRFPEILRGYDLLIPGNFPAHIWTALQHHPVPVIWLCFEPKRNLYPNIMYAEALHTRAWGFRTAADDDYKGWRGKWRLLTHDPHVLLPYWMRSGLQRLLDQCAVRHIDHILTTSAYAAEKIQQIYPAKPVDVIHAGFPLPELSPESDALILIPTRLEPIKNVEIVLRAAQRLRLQDALQGYQIVIMGEGSERARLEQLCSELALDTQVRFTGYVSNTERDSLYARCRIVVYPSLAEPFGLPCIEAGLYAKPVIASHRGGPATIIKDGETGLSVDMTQPDSLADAIKHLIDNPDAAVKMGKAAREYLEPVYGLENWTANLEAKLLALKTTYHT